MGRAVTDSNLTRLLTRAGLPHDDQLASVVTETEAGLILAMTGPGVSAFALRALVYCYLIHTPFESELGTAWAVPGKSERTLT